MSTAQPLSTLWKERLDLTARDVPEFYEDPSAVGQSTHAGAIRTALAELGASAVFCVQEVPTVVIVHLDEYDSDSVINLHGALWNQGLATLLLVLSGDTLRAFSLARIPRRDRDTFDARCLVQTLDAATDALAAKGFIYGAESGRLWEQHDRFFRVEERIDRVLLNNLTASCKALGDDDLPPDAAQALLIQTMFIAYLEDREIVRSDVFADVSRATSTTFLELLQSSNPRALHRLFARLRDDFNGDLFVAPCSFELQESPLPVSQAHMKTLERFRSGHEEVGEHGGQLRFWGYDFRYIPIELISAVYDRFLGDQENARRRRGAYYTPMFLADTVIMTLWQMLPPQTRERGRFLDPACGSGVFLVRAFQLLCEHWRNRHTSRTIPWPRLCSILQRLHGWDLNPAAVRVAIFSLYLALLQEVRPPEIRLLLKRGTQLPQLWNRTLCAHDFFEVPSDTSQADVVFGNPPWFSRQGMHRSSVRWTIEHQLPMPDNEDAWAFVWKALRHVRGNGVVGFLLPAMGFLHNHRPNAVEARRRLLRDARVFRIVNFADMRFQLFEHARRPATLVVFGPGTTDGPAYRVDYWTPRTDLNLHVGRAITLSSVDKQTITSRDALDDPSIFNRRLWMSGPESKLFGYLRSLPQLSDLVTTYHSGNRDSATQHNRWVVGYGFQPAQRNRLSEIGYRYQYSEPVATTPHLPIRAFRALAQHHKHLQTFRARMGLPQRF